MTLGRQADITLFLIQFKMISQSRFVLVPREKNMKDIAMFGIGIPEVKNTIYNLTYKNYISGPEKDFGNKKYNVWKFGVEIGGNEFYIKLSDDFRGNEARCISFHKADSACKYPFRAS